MKILCAIAASALLLLAGAASARADSIAYIKDGNVWLSTPDGSRQYQVTSSGGYSDVSQADDGTLIALNGVRLHKLARDGSVLADFDTPVSDTRPAPAKTFYGPYDPAISPDGTKVAYTYYYMTQSQSNTCFPPECVVAINEGGTGYSWADRQTGWDDPALGYHSGWRFPVWVDGDMTLLSNPTHALNADVILDRISDGGNGHGNLVMNWFSDVVDNPGVGGGDITRDKRKLALQTGENDSTLTVYFVGHFPTAWRDMDAVDSQVTRCYRYENPVGGGAFGIPTFAPDGSALAFTEGDGLHVAAVPNFVDQCTLDGATATPPLVIPGATQPDWGPADVPAARPAQPTPPPPPAAGRPSASSLSVRVLSTAHRTVKLQVTAPGKGRLSATA